MKNSVSLFLFLIILFCSVDLFALGGNNESPLFIEGATTINVQQAKELFNNGVVFIDSRKDVDWEAGRIPEAVHLELKKVLSKKSLSAVVGKKEAVVMYCNGPKCMRSSETCKKAVEWGFKKVYYFRDGFPAWKAAKFPVE